MMSYFLQVSRALCAGSCGGAAAWATRGELLLLHASQESHIEASQQQCVRKPGPVRVLLLPLLHRASYESLHVFASSKDLNTCDSWLHLVHCPMLSLV
jgi:hypothetical protein